MTAAASSMLIGLVLAEPQARAKLPDPSLTPVGALRAGDATGAVPPWTGGVSSRSDATRAAKTMRAERALFSITRANLRDYADRLPEGAKALFARDADFRINVYPTHRSAAFPSSVYDAVGRNATTAHAVRQGCRYGIAGAAGGIPFPMPQNGCEVVWNHLLAYWGPARDARLQTYVVFGRNDVEKTSEREEIADFPYYQAATPDAVGPYYLKRREKILWPADRAGGGYIACQPLDVLRTRFASWEYLPGQRRVRKSPSLSYDTPDPDASGLESFDDYYIFSGGLDHYDYALLGKREMVIPYNDHLYDLAAPDILGPHHADPSKIRYEIHRVWVVDARLAPGHHDVVPHRRLYFDEDTWLAAYEDEWDASGRLWKFAQGGMDLLPDLPAILLGSQLVYDLQYNAYVYDFAFGKPDGSFRLVPPHPASAYTPEGMAVAYQR